MCSEKLMEESKLLGGGRPVMRCRSLNMTQKENTKVFTGKVSRVSKITKSVNVVIKAQNYADLLL
jgi:hypothetical protein